MSIVGASSPARKPAFWEAFLSRHNQEKPARKRARKRTVGRPRRRNFLFNQTYRRSLHLFRVTRRQNTKLNKEVENEP